MLRADLASAFQKKARSGAVCLGIHSSAMSPQLIELYGAADLDFVIIGAEVESLDYGRMEELVRAADSADVVPIVKLRRPDVDLIGEAMNTGAPMVMVPHVTRRAQLDTIIRASRFEPKGLRGVCPIARYNAYGAGNLYKTREVANRAHSVIPVIEDAEALDHLDELMTCKEVDIFEIGPFDLSNSLGEKEPGYHSAKTMAAIDSICAAARRHGKAILAPIWQTLENDSYPKMLQHQMDELIARGINCLYEGEAFSLYLHLTRLNVLNLVKEVPGDAPARNGKGAGTSSKRRRVERRPASARSRLPRP